MGFFSFSDIKFPRYHFHVFEEDLYPGQTEVRQEGHPDLGRDVHHLHRKLLNREVHGLVEGLPLGHVEVDQDMLVGDLGLVELVVHLGFVQAQGPGVGVGHEVVPEVGVPELGLLLCMVVQVYLDAHGLGKQELEQQLFRERGDHLVSRSRTVTRWGSQRGTSSSTPLLRRIGRLHISHQ